MWGGGGLDLLVANNTKNPGSGFEAHGHFCQGRATRLVRIPHRDSVTESSRVEGMASPFQLGVSGSGLHRPRSFSSR